MAKSPLTKRDHELLAMPSIISQLPLVFANNSVWDEFDGKCSCCSKTLSRDHVRGVVSRPFSNVAVVEAAGVCGDCKLVTRFDYRMHDDMRLTGLREDGWKTWQATPTLFDRLTAMLGDLWR